MTADEVFTKPDSDRLLIIGNGFDLSLGLETKYSDFARSDKWPNQISNEYFFAYLNNKKNTEYWFDLEQVLGAYEKSMGNVRPIEFNCQKYHPQAGNDLVFFQMLSDALRRYLSDIQQKDVDANSVGAKVLCSVMKNGFFNRIVTFNYTDLRKIGQKVGVNMSSVDIEYIHGNLEDGIVLGVPEDIELSPRYDFLYKTSSNNYASHPLPYYLNHASEVVFFGHSLSDNDYFYFDDFFKKISCSGLDKEDGKYITIFIYNEASRLAILRQLRKHLTNQLPLLFAQNHLEFIKTDGSDTKRLQSFIERQEATNLVNSIDLK